MAEFPEYKRTTGIAASSDVPDFAEAMRGVASASWGSVGALGASVAQSASTQMAKQVGYQLGQEPSGDLNMPITDFDKQVAETYHAQSYATLTLQANQMFYDADNALNQAPYVTPELINNTRREMMGAVEGIVGNAPNAVKTQLTQQLYSQIQASTHGYQNKMISQNKDLARSQIKSTIQQNNTTITNLQMAGDAKGAEQVAENTKKVIQVGYWNASLTPEERDSYKKQVEDTHFASEYVSGYANARANNKGAEYMRDLAANKKIPQDKKDLALNAVFKYKNELDTANAEYENIRTGEMKNRIALGDYDAVQSDLVEFKNQVSPERYQEVEHTLIQAMKKSQSEGVSISEIQAGWNNPDVMARAKPETINKGFDALTAALMKRGADTGNQISKDNAEVQVAAAAAVPVPAFKAMTEARILNGDPNQMQGAVQQIQALRSMNRMGALQGLSPLAQAVAQKFENLLPYKGAVEAAKEASELRNMSGEQQEEIMTKWTNKISNAGADAPYKVALKDVGLSTKDFLNSGMGFYYGTQILDVYRSNFIWAHGDEEIAKKMTKDYVDQRFGDTHINGAVHTTENPIERALGYEVSDVVPYIHDDAATQLNKRFDVEKQMFFAKDNKTGKYLTDTYFEIVPPDPQGATHFKSDYGILGHFEEQYPPLQLVRHYRDKDKVITKTHNVVFNGNDAGNWDVALDDEGHLSSLFSFDHNLGVVTYTPDKKAIDNNYRKKNHIAFPQPEGEVK